MGVTGDKANDGLVIASGDIKEEVDIPRSGIVWVRGNVSQEYNLQCGLGVTVRKKGYIVNGKH